MTKTFDEVISGVRTAKKGVEVREDLAQMGEYCKQFTEEAGTRADAAKEAAQTAATNAKASEKKATDAVAGIEQTKTDAVQAVQNAQTTATTAVQQAQSTATTAVTTKQTEAVRAVGTAQAGAVKAVDDERDAALQQVKSSTQAAQTAASNAAASAQAAQASKEAAATSAGAAESSATAASGSASAAATSESNAATSAQSAETDADRAEAAAELAGTRANTDKTLKTENAPADAKAVGDYILDADGNVIFYSKAAVDELLAGKLDLTGGTMSGKILINAIGKDVIKISGSTENADEEIEFERTDTGAALACGIGAGGENMGLFDRTNGKWVFHVKATTGEVYIGGTKCLGFVVASGSNYVRFGDGTQICWGGVGLNGAITDSNVRVTYPLPFGENPKVFTTLNANIGIHIPVGVGWETSTSFTIGTSGTSSTGHTSWLAIGRWK